MNACGEPQSELRWALARACTCGALVLPATAPAEQLCRRAVAGGDFIGVSLLELSRSPPESQEVMCDRCCKASDCK